MRLQLNSRRWTEYILLTCLIATLPAAHLAEAKGPAPPEPQPDFIVETAPIEDTIGDYVISGAVVDTGVYSHNSPWYVDDEGVAWVRHRFSHRGFEETNYFEVYLPGHPERGVEYVTVLTAGPDGYSDGQNTYHGEWSVAIVTARIVNVSVRIATDWSGKHWKTVHFPLPEYKIHGFFTP